MVYALFNSYLRWLHSAIHENDTADELDTKSEIVQNSKFCTAGTLSKKIYKIYAKLQYVC